MSLLRKKVRDPRLLRLLGAIVESHTPGIPIGNLTSQLFANIYLNEFDHFVKRELREQYYVRYMDDFIILGTDKRHLREAIERIAVFLSDRLRLKLHPKKAEIFPIDAAGIDFLGYVVCRGGRPGRRSLRKSTVKRFRKRLRLYLALVRAGKLPAETLRNALASWSGYAAFAAR